MKIALLSIPPEALKKFVADDDRLDEPLRKLGYVAELVPWQSATEWQNYAGVVIRTTWDYQDNLEAFLRVLQQIEAQTRLANPIELVRWNADKNIYLRGLEGRGAKIIPTIWHNSKIVKSLIEQWF